MHIQLFQYICGKHYPFIIGLTEHIVKSQLTIYIGVYFWTLLDFTVLCLSFLQDYTLLDHRSFVASLEIRSMKFSKLLFCKIIVTLLCSLNFHIILESVGQFLKKHTLIPKNPLIF